MHIKNKLKNIKNLKYNSVPVSDLQTQSDANTIWEISQQAGKVTLKTRHFVTLPSQAIGTPTTLESKPVDPRIWTNTVPSHPFLIQF